MFQDAVGQILAMAEHQLDSLHWWNFTLRLNHLQAMVFTIRYFTLKVLWVQLAAADNVCHCTHSWGTDSLHIMKGDLALTEKLWSQCSPIWWYIQYSSYNGIWTLCKQLLMSTRSSQLTLFVWAAIWSFQITRGRVKIKQPKKGIFLILWWPRSTLSLTYCKFYTIFLFKSKCCEFGAQCRIPLTYIDQCNR